MYLIDVMNSAVPEEMQEIF